MKHKPWQLQLKIDSKSWPGYNSFPDWTTVRRYLHEKRARQALGVALKGRLTGWEYRLFRDESDGPIKWVGSP